MHNTGRSDCERACSLALLCVFCTVFWALAQRVHCVCACYAFCVGCGYRQVSTLQFVPCSVNAFWECAASSVAHAQSVVSLPVALGLLLCMLSSFRLRACGGGSVCMCLLFCAAVVCLRLNWKHAMQVMPAMLGFMLQVLGVMYANACCP